MNESKKHKLLKTAFSKDSIAILQFFIEHPTRIGGHHYISVLKKMGLGKKDSGGFAYYIRALLELNLLSKNIDNEYLITKKGKQFLNLFHHFDEKFITNDQCMICHNSDGSNEHDFVQVCKNCSYIKEDDQK